MAWTQSRHDRPHDDTGYVFVANYDLESDSGYFGIPALAADIVLRAEFSTWGAVDATDVEITHNPVIQNGTFGPGTIEYRFGSTTATITNNLTDGPIWQRIEGSIGKKRTQRGDVGLIRISRSSAWFDCRNVV